MKAISPVRKGQTTQTCAIVRSFERFTSAPAASPTPAIPPTIAWEVETGSLKKVANVTKSPEEISAAKIAAAGSSVVTIPFPIVFITY
jgi:hypothetical protein